MPLDQPKTPAKESVDDGLRRLTKEVRDQIVMHWAAISAPLRKACEGADRAFDEHGEIAQARIVAAVANYWVSASHLQSHAERANPLGDIKRAIGELQTGVGELLELLSKADEQGLRYDVAMEFEELEGLEKYQRWLVLSGEMRDAFERAEAKHRGQGKRRSGHRRALCLSLAWIYAAATGLAAKDGLGRRGTFRNFVSQVLDATGAAHGGKNSLDDDLHDWISGEKSQK